MISVVIPTLNEAMNLPGTLTAVRGAADGVACEIIVVDGGSTDGTVGLAQAAGCLVVRSPRAGRAVQMNAGAVRARGDLFLFLHADTLLPCGALAAVVTACARPGVVGGGFVRRYASRSPWLWLTCRLASVRNRWVGWHLGDQAMFVRRGAFEGVGGFREMEMFEDVDFSRRLRRGGAVVTRRPAVGSSARRFERRGPFQTSVADLRLTLRYLADAAPAGRGSYH